MFGQWGKDAYDTYDDYLASDKWREKRQRVLQRDGFKCFACGSDVDLNVHHLTYERIYQERIEDLVTLCRSCHRAYHVVSKLSESNHRELVRRERLLNAKRIFEKYRNYDLVAGGPLNMCNWKELDKILDQESRLVDDEYLPSKTELKDRFLYARYQIMLDHMNKGTSMSDFMIKEKLPYNFILKWYGEKEKLTRQMEIIKRNF